MVALSTTEAEYIACVAAGKEVLWMQTLLKELHFEVMDASPMVMDNTSSIAVVMDPQHHSRMKHLDISIHWIHDEVKNGQIAPHYIHTDDMTEDIFMKALPCLAIKRHQHALGVM